MDLIKEIKLRWRSEMPAFFKRIYRAWITVTAVAGYVVVINNPQLAAQIGVDQSVFDTLNIIKTLFPAILTPKLITLCQYLTAIGVFVSLHVRLTKKTPDAERTPDHDHIDTPL